MDRASRGVVCGHKMIPLYEMRKEQPEVDGEGNPTPCWTNEVKRTWSEQSGPTLQGLGVVQELLKLCAVPSGTEVMKRCSPEKNDPKEHGNKLKKTSQGIKKQGAGQQG